MSAELGFSTSDSSRPASTSSASELSVATAHWCASQDWPVHPLAPGQKTPAANCADCRSNSHPPASCACLPAGRWCHGFYAATLDHVRIQQWWGRHPQMGVGVSCGPAGLVVIDIDAHSTQLPARDRLLPGIPIGDHVDLTGLANGFHTLAVLAALRGQPTPAQDQATLRVRTPSGGLHVWYRATDGRRWRSSVGSGMGRALAWQVDIRAHGSYIVAPRTTIRSGTYTPIGDCREPRPLPEWLADELERTGHLTPSTVPAPRQVPPRARQAVLAAGGHHRAEYTLASVLDPIKMCGQVAEGAGFSQALNRAAYTVGGLVAAGRIRREEAEQALRDAAQAARPGQERRIDQIIRSGLAAGLKYPLHSSGRCP